MATYGQAIRRGLPRVPGGAPWPTGGDAPAVAVAAEPASSVGTVQVAVTAASVAATPQDVTPEPAAARRDVTPEPEPAAAAGSGPAPGAVPLRRGLPRVQGGEPWPPATAARPVRVADAAGSAAVTPQNATPDRVADAVAGVRVADAAGSAAVTPQNVTPEPAGAVATTGTALRRGLPRVAGGEPWPPAGAVTPVAAVAAPPVVERVERAETPVTSPTTAVATVPAVDLSVPLPFTRTVWPGKNAFIHPPPAPEPKRYGPFTRLEWAGAVIVGGGGLLFAAGMAVLFVRWLLTLPFMVDFLVAYPGEYPLPEGSPVGMPPWLGWQHFFNVFLIVLIIRSGLQVRTEKRPTAFWSPRSNGRRKISLNLWFHQSLDILWIVNGVIFVVLLLVTGQWVKIVPTSWAVFPNALSAGLQYVSLDWPTENGWVNYNSLQQLAYFATVFLAAPLAIITGVRMSGIWPKNAKTLSRVYPVEWARAVHFPVMLYFVLFIFVHVVLVFATGALRNLNHMYASQDAVNWVGFWIFAASLVVIAAGWIAARPLVLAPIAKLFGRVSGR